METDFFKYTRRQASLAAATGSFEVANSRTSTLSRLSRYLGGESLPFSMLSPEFIRGFEEWLVSEGLKESTVRLYLNQMNAIYNNAVREGIAPRMCLLKDVKAPQLHKKERDLLSEDELRLLRHADLSDSRALTFARDMFFFSIYGRGISFNDMAHIRKSDIQGSLLTYTSQVANLPRITVRWDSGMQEISGRYPSSTGYLFPFITSDDREEASREMNRVRDNILRAFRRIKSRCNLSVAPTMYMTRDIYLRAVERVSVSSII